MIRGRRWPVAAWVLIVLAGVNAILQVNRMVRAVAYGQTDFSVFHRTACWLAAALVVWGSVLATMAPRKPTTGRQVAVPS